MHWRPNPNGVELIQSETPIYAVFIEGEDYDICKESSKHRWCNGKTGTYGEGLIKNPALVGLLGEMAFAKIYDLDVDLEYHHGGDVADFIINGKTIDVKCSSSPKSECVHVLRRDFERNTGFIDIKHDYYVGCSLYEKHENHATILVRGFMTKNQVRRLDTRYGKKKSCLNNDLFFDQMKPMYCLEKTLFKYHQNSHNRISHEVVRTI